MLKKDASNAVLCVERVLFIAAFKNLWIRIYAFINVTLDSARSFWLENAKQRLHRFFAVEKALLGFAAFKLSG